jgi:hypothetical protein
MSFLPVDGVMNGFCKIFLWTTAGFSMVQNGIKLKLPARRVLNEKG